MANKAIFSPARPRRAKTRLSSGKAATNEAARCRFVHIEPLNDVRTKPDALIAILHR